MGLADLNVGGMVEKVDGKHLSYEEFVDRFLKKNQPVVLTGLMDEWRACKDWVTGDGRPDLHFVSTHFGKSSVQVADCSKREFTDQKRTEMSVSEYISNWLGLYTANSSNDSTCSIDKQTLLYLKDWHFVKEYPQYVAYRTPHLFTDDWLNLYLDSYHMHGDVNNSDDKYEINCSDYRFVYMGAKGTWTPLHADVFRSYSWSANVCGRKLWFFLPPGQCHLLFDRYLKNSVYDISDYVNEKKYPGFKETVWLECTQEKNEIIFVPSGWYHQVYNLEDAISINHNWFNGYNLIWVWNLLVRDYNEAKDYIEDIREISDDFEGLCQQNLATNTGMNFLDFFIFIARFSLANLLHLHHLKTNFRGSISCTSKKVQSLVSNMIFVRHVTLKLKSAEAFSIENLHRHSADNHDAFFGINKILEEPRFLDLWVALDRTYETLEETLQTDLNLKNTSCRSVLNHSKEDFVGNYHNQISSFKVFGPEALVGLIDCVITDFCGLYPDFNFNLPSEVSNYDSSTVVL